MLFCGLRQSNYTISLPKTQVDILARIRYTNKKAWKGVSGGMLAEKTVDLLMGKGWKIAFAESCTGGLAAAALVDVPNASAVLDASIVTYANGAKIKYLGVMQESIERQGVVSEEVAGQMAVGVARANAADVGVGISGIAGPGGGTPDKPVGMVCFGFFVDGRLTVRTVQFGAAGRNAVRRASVEYVYRTLEELLAD